MKISQMQAMVDFHMTRALAAFEKGHIAEMHTEEAKAAKYEKVLGTFAQARIRLLGDAA
jgi:hypothetical protein